MCDWGRSDCGKSNDWLFWRRASDSPDLEREMWSSTWELCSAVKHAASWTYGNQQGSRSRGPCCGLAVVTHVGETFTIFGLLNSFLLQLSPTLACLADCSSHQSVTQAPWVGSHMQTTTGPLLLLRALKGFHNCHKCFKAQNRKRLVLRSFQTKSAFF